MKKHKKVLLVLAFFMLFSVLAFLTVFFKQEQVAIEVIKALVQVFTESFKDLSK